MAPFFPKPIFVIAPGAGLQPAHYGLLMHLLMKAGYGVVSAMLPSCGTGDKATVQDDAEYIRERMVLPILENEGHNVIIIGHSYAGLPSSAAVAGLGKLDRAKAGKATSVLGQICLATILVNGGEEKNLLDTFQGQTPGHVKMDEPANRVRCPDPIPALFQDVENLLADCAVASCMDPSLTCFESPIPRASFGELGYAGRLAYIKTTMDCALPPSIQDMLIEKADGDWTVREIAAGHDAQLSQPEKLSEIIVELARLFEGMV